MSNTTLRPIPTLKGIFSVPRPNPAERNFLKENKKSLRTLEKTTTEKLAAKEPVRPKWMPPLRRTASEARELSSETGSEVCLLRQQKQNSRSQQRLTKTVSDERYDGLNKASIQTIYPPPERRDQVEEKSSVELCVERCQSCGSQRTSSGTSIGIQTEDITDQLYLTNALKKCSLDSKSIAGENRFDGGGDYDDNYGSYSQYQDDNEQPLSARSRGSIGHKQASIHNSYMDEHVTMPMPAADGYGDEDEAPLSARSRATIASVASNATTKSKRRPHKLGSRDNLLLPHYLEKEKREKAEAKERFVAKDPDCPQGHVLLSEAERLSALNGAQQRFDKLIHELNHMPMTAQTLRVRARKAEIDKELTVVEDEIRIFSKAKVYVKANKSRNL
ncbi:CG11125 [Drosophila busckii]|uniref:CG11125 n=1 Tax=Drosophila busckii TaxID=30019 RepID=A0A0M3QUL8_DROBS|nr:uncharacterized protein LOC108596458 [Drosophila busckii]ALC40853.1 CG11125 [Drosophila busckii]